jgi:protein-S-isoprenylcysteine O-methyltransferase Ste14
MTRGRAALGSLAFLLFAPGTVAGLVPYWITGWELHPPLLGLEVMLWVGAALVAAGLAVLLDSFARFALRGLGTPAPVAPPTRLVVTGLYRHVRNPMYVAVLSAVVGQALVLGDVKLLGYALLVWLAFHLFVVGYEEPKLRRTFGEEYELFLRNVPRWIPRLRPWNGRWRPAIRREDGGASRRTPLE